MQLTAEQQRVIEQGAEHLESGNGNLPVNALAGSGKTFTLKRLAGVIAERGDFFNPLDLAYVAVTRGRRSVEVPARLEAEIDASVPREPVTRVRKEKPQPLVPITRAKEPEVENTDELLDRLFV